MNDASRTTATGLWTDGKGMLAAAEVLMREDNRPTKMQFFMVTHFLLGHGIEVMLKSVLLAHGYGLDELRKKIGHDLTKAARRVINLDLDPVSSFVASNSGLVRQLNCYYSRKHFEYRVTGAMHLPPTEEIAAFLGHLVKMTRPKL